MSSEAIAPLLPDNVVPLDGMTPVPSSPEDAAFMAAAPLDIQDLVDAPCRALDVEYKSWRNLNHPEDRAELARDIAALANHGGGFVVFGFDEQTLASDNTDPFRTNCTLERVTAIGQAYLDPPPACEVTKVVSAANTVHSVIRVPAHGTMPVCIRQDGPTVDGEKIIARGALYVRKSVGVSAGQRCLVPRQQSARIDMPEDWAPLIRRCVRRDREALLGMLEATIEGRSTAPEPALRLRTWHQAARAAFLALVPRSPVADNLARRHYALSYSFDLVRPEMVEHAQLPERLRATVFELQADFRSGWNMFDPPYRRGVLPRFLTDPACGVDDADFLETAWLRARNPDETADFWRVSPTGMATIIRSFAEDMTLQNPLPPIPPGTCLSPFLLAQEVSELVCHARAFSRLFTGVRRVAFHCEWWGLAGRELYDPDQRWPHRGPALGDHAVAILQVPLARLAKAWPEVVARLMAPVARTVEPDLVLDADWVREQAPRWAVAQT